MLTGYATARYRLPPPRLIRIVEPVGLPVSVDEVRSQSRISGDVELGVIYRHVLAATAHVERTIQRSLLTQTWRLTYDYRFPPVIELLRPPIQSVTSVTYRSSLDGATTTLASSEYRVLLNGDRGGRIEPVYNSSWPLPQPVIEAVTIEYVAGWATAGDVPADIKHAILLLAATWFENREATSDLRLNEIPFGVESLLVPYKQPPVV